MAELLTFPPARLRRAWFVREFANQTWKAVVYDWYTRATLDHERSGSRDEVLRRIRSRGDGLPIFHDRAQRGGTVGGGTAS